MCPEKTKSKVVVLKTNPYRVLDIYKELMHLAEYEKYISKEIDTLSEGFMNFIAKVTRNWNICFYESPLTSEQRLSIKKTFTKHPSAFQFKAPHMPFKRRTRLEEYSFLQNALDLANKKV